MRRDRSKVRAFGRSLARPPEQLVARGIEETSAVNEESPWCTACLDGVENARKCGCRDGHRKVRVGWLAGAGRVRKGVSGILSLNFQNSRTTQILRWCHGRGSGGKIERVPQERKTIPKFSIPFSECLPHCLRDPEAFSSLRTTIKGRYKP